MSVITRLTCNNPSLLQGMLSVALDNECCVISVAVDYRVLPETITYTVGPIYNLTMSHPAVMIECCL